MANESQSFERGGVPMCSACGQRPGAVQLVVSTESGQKGVAAELVQRGGRALVLGRLTAAFSATRPTPGASTR